jgi:hypothetical protein
VRVRGLVVDNAPRLDRPALEIPSFEIKLIVQDRDMEGPPDWRVIQAQILSELRVYRRYFEDRLPGFQQARRERRVEPVPQQEAPLYAYQNIPQQAYRFEYNAAQQGILANVANGLQYEPNFWAPAHPVEGGQGANPLVPNEPDPEFG